MTILAPIDTSIGRATFRLLDPAVDFRAAAALISTTHAHDGIDWLPTTEVIAHDWRTVAGFDPATDAVIAESNGEAVALAALSWRIREGTVVHNMEIWVRPDARRRRIGDSLVDWAEAHARAAVAAGLAGPPGAPQVIGGWGDGDVPGHDRLAAKHGYAVFRYGFEMRRPVDAPIPEAPLPEGLEIRPVVANDHRAIWTADTEAFRDHFEPTVRTEEDFVGWFAAPSLDTSLWQVAWDGDEVAGSIMTSINAEENAKIGLSLAWLDHVSVRRRWRQRGLAAALIASTLRLLRDRGAEVAALGVDAQSLTGALHLYEKMGFTRHRTGINYRKPLER